VSHIGRAYARWLPPAEAARHRIIRRGIPYGSPWEAGHDDEPRGLLFVTYQADVERQFEHVWRRWLNGPDFPRPGAGRDALVGQISPPGGQRPALFARHGQSGRYSAVRLSGFVTPHYGGYFLAPSISALSFLATRRQDDFAHSPWSR
jgi:deferrochelatase/peroxidase EfeB